MDPRPEGCVVSVAQSLRIVGSQIVKAEILTSGISDKPKSDANCCHLQNLRSRIAEELPVVGRHRLALDRARAEQ